MRTVRYGVFETNSSSQHSLSLMTCKDYDTWKKDISDKGETVFVDVARGGAYWMTPSERDKKDFNENRYLLKYSEVEPYIDSEKTEDYKNEYGVDMVAVSILTEDF